MNCYGTRTARSNLKTSGKLEFSRCPEYNISKTTFYFFTPDTYKIIKLEVSGLPSSWKLGFCIGVRSTKSLDFQTSVVSGLEKSVKKLTNGSG